MFRRHLFLLRIGYGFATLSCRHRLQCAVASG